MACSLGADLQQLLALLALLVRESAGESVAEDGDARPFEKLLDLLPLRRAEAAVAHDAQRLLLRRVELLPVALVAPLRLELALLQLDGRAVRAEGLPGAVRPR